MELSVAAGTDPDKFTGLDCVAAGVELTVELMFEHPAAINIMNNPQIASPVIFFMCISSLVFTQWTAVTRIQI